LYPSWVEYGSKTRQTAGACQGGRAAQTASAEAMD
jgi:hypothetical protein